MNIKINKSQTYGDQCDQKRRPRIGFSIIKSYFKNDSDFQEVYNGSITDLL